MDLNISVSESCLTVGCKTRQLCIIGHSGDDETVLWRGAAAGPNHALLQAGLAVVRSLGEAVRLDLHYDLIGGDGAVESIRVLDEALMTKPPQNHRAPATDNAVEPKATAVGGAPVDPTVRDLTDAMEILASLRDDPEEPVGDVAWSLLNSAHWHVQRALRSHFTGR